MTADARVEATPPGVTLAPLETIADGAARNFVLQLRDGRFHGFVVRRGEAVFGYVDRCPHMGWPLARVLDDYVKQGEIICSWHLAAFSIDDGRCLRGPCEIAGLTPWPVTVRDGMLVTG